MMKSALPDTCIGEAEDGSVAFTEGLNLMAVDADVRLLRRSGLPERRGLTLSALLTYNRKIGEFET